MTATIGGPLSETASRRLYDLCHRQIFAWPNAIKEASSYEAFIEGLSAIKGAMIFFEDEVNYADWADMVSFIREFDLTAILHHGAGDDYGPGVIYLAPGVERRADANHKGEIVIPLTELAEASEKGAIGEALAYFSVFDEPLPELTLPFLDKTPGVYAVTFSVRRWERLTVQIEANHAQDARQKALAMIDAAGGPPSGDWDAFDIDGAVLIEDNIRLLRSKQ